MPVELGEQYEVAAMSENLWGDIQQNDRVEILVSTNWKRRSRPTLFI